MAYFFFNLKMLVTSKVWAIISNIIKPKRTNLLKNLYKSILKLIPNKIECIIKNTAEKIPKYKKYLLLFSLLSFFKKVLYSSQNLINKIEVIIMPGLNNKYVG